MASCWFAPQVEGSVRWGSAIGLISATHHLEPASAKYFITQARMQFPRPAVSFGFIERSHPGQKI